LLNYLILKGRTEEDGTNVLSVEEKITLENEKQKNEDKENLSILFK
jgi:hypothetical protein